MLQRLICAPFDHRIPAAIRVFFRSRADTSLEVLALRQQVAVLKRKRPRPPLNHLDRFFWTTLRNIWPRWSDVLVTVKPETVVGWHRSGFRLYWRWRSRARGGRPKLSEEVRTLIRRMAYENSALGSTEDPRRTAEARLRGLRAHCRQISATLAATRQFSQTLACLPRKPSRSDRRLRLLYRAHADLPGPVLLLRNRAWPAQGSALQRH